MKKFILFLLFIFLFFPQTALAANISSGGTGYIWSANSTSTSNSNRVAKTNVNDNNFTTDFPLSSSPDVLNAWQAAGIVWSTTQNNVNKVEFTNGSWFTPWGGDGAFMANFKLQFTTDGTTWSDSGWSNTPAYDYGSSNAAFKKYTFTGSDTSVRGIRVTGQVHTADNSSWFDNAAEVNAFTNDGVTPTPTPTNTPTPTPSVNSNRPDHIVVVVEENRKLQDVLRVDYFTYLATQGALMVNTKGLTHPSQPNYFALFSGSLQGLTDDTCPPPSSPFSTNNLGNQLLTNTLSFIGYAENMPSNPRTNCTNTNGWDNNHTPWLHFSNLVATTSAVFTSFPSDYSTLPAVSFVIPNLNHNAHDGTIQDASDWLKSNIENYRIWTMTHNSILIVTFDEDDETADNTIYTVFAGQKIKKGIYNESLTLYNILSTIEDLYNLPHLNSAQGIIDIFN